MRTTKHPPHSSENDNPDNLYRFWWKRGRLTLQNHLFLKWLFEPHLLVSKGVNLHLLWLSWRVPNPPGTNPLVAERAPGGLRSLVRQGVSSLLEIPTNSCHFFRTPGNPCATPTVTRGEGSFSYQGVSTSGGRHSPVKGSVGCHERRESPGNPGNTHHKTPVPERGLLELLHQWHGFPPPVLSPLRFPFKGGRHQSNRSWGGYICGMLPPLFRRCRAGIAKCLPYHRGQNYYKKPFYKNNF